MAIVEMAARRQAPRPLAQFLEGPSIEVMPRTADKIDDFRPLLAPGTRVYIAHIDGTPFEDMLSTAKRLQAQGFAVMPHLPARSIPDQATLELWLTRYAQEAGVTQALVLAGGAEKLAGSFTSSMELLETGLFDKLGYRHLHVAGHPEGNRDIDPKGGTAEVDAALRWKQAFSDRTDAQMAIATQFAFDAAPVIAWAERLADAGITLPIHVGVAGPAKLQTLIKYAVACGVGASIKVLQRRARDLTKLVAPFEPDAVVTELSDYVAAHPDSLIKGAHLFPLGGITASANWLAAQGPVRG